jgi:hypothetical protein
MDEKIYTIEKIKQKYFNGDYTTKLKYNKKFEPKLPDDFILDTNKSAEENAEMVKKHNEDNLRRKSEYLKDFYKLYKQLREDVTDYIMNRYKFSIEQARAVEEFAFHEKHNSMYQYFDYIDTVAELCAKF